MKVGPYTIGRTKKTEPEVQVIEAPKEKLYLGSMLDMSTMLSNETSVSDKLIKAYEEWVYVNVSVLSEEISKLKLNLFETNFRGGELVMEETQEHPLLSLIDKFNDTTTSSDGFYMTAAHLELVGDAFWYLNGLDDIFILQPDKVELVLGDFNNASRRLVDAYEYSTVVKDKTIKQTYSPDEIIPFRVPNPANPYRGKSTVQAAATTIDTDNMSIIASKKFYEQGMIGDFALETENKLNADQIKNAQAQLRASRTGYRNAFKVPIFSGGLKVRELRASNKDIELIKQQEWLRNKIMAVFKNNKVSLGITDDVNRANAEASIAEWRRSVIKPKMQRIVDALNEYLVPKFGDNLILGFEDPTPEDRVEKIKEIEALYAKNPNKVITLNEARELVGFDSVDDQRADEVFDPENPREQDLPKQVRNVDWKRHFRKMKLYSKYKEYTTSHAIAKATLKQRMKDENPDIKKPTKAKVNNFWKRVAEIIEKYEDVFGGHLEGFITSIAEEAAANLEDEQARKNGDLFNRETKLLQAQALFTPILMETLVLAGKEANDFLGIDEPFVPKKLKQVDTESFVREAVEMFAIGMMDTDKDVLANIISSGLAEGSGVPAIRRAIQEKFAQFAKTQAERITRTEVARAANRGITDSYALNGIETRQWLTAPGACAYCEPLNGKTVSVSENFFDKGDEWLGDAKTPLKLDYADVGEPPLHPNCRCTTIAVTETFGALLPEKATS